MHEHEEVWRTSVSDQVLRMEFGSETEEATET
jgi:hypothetical protein